MEIQLYKTTSENNRLDKVLTDVKQVVGSCRDSIDVETPLVTIKDKFDKTHHHKFNNFLI